MANHHGSERQAAKSGCGSALDPPRLHIEDPCECDHDWKASGERDDDIRKHRIGPMQPVRDGLDDLQNCERRDSVPTRARNTRRRFSSPNSKVGPTALTPASTLTHHGPRARTSTRLDSRDPPAAPQKRKSWRTAERSMASAAKMPSRSRSERGLSKVTLTRLAPAARSIRYSSLVLS